MFTYNTKGTCSRQIIFDVDGEHKLHNVKFIGGCGGNLQGIARLVEGKDIDEVAGHAQGHQVPQQHLLPRPARARHRRIQGTRRQAPRRSGARGKLKKREKRETRPPFPKNGGRVPFFSASPSFPHI